MFPSLHHFATQNMKILSDILSPFALFSKERTPKLSSGSFRNEGRRCVCYLWKFLKSQQPQDTQSPWQLDKKRAARANSFFFFAN